MQFSHLTEVLWKIRDWGSNKHSFAGSRKGIGPSQAQEDANDGDAHHGEEMRRVRYICATNLLTPRPRRIAVQVITALFIRNVLLLVQCRLNI